MERTFCEKLKPRFKFGVANIFVGNRLFEAIPPTVKDVFEDGNMVLLYESTAKEYAERLSVELRENGYRVFMKDASEKADVPEYTRFVFGVGAGHVVEETKRLATALSLDCAVMLTAPSDDGILQGDRIKQVYLDSGILSQCPRECVAAGWGIVLSEPMLRFESYFAEKVLGAPHENLPRLKELPTDADETSLALRLLELSSLRGGEDNASVMARLLSDAATAQGVQKRLHGEYKFICASVLAVYYSCFLGSPSIDCAPPPSHDSAIDEIVKLTGRNREMLINSFDFFDTNSYFRINYILGEYRLDLLERLRSIDMHSAQKRWRRLYPDAGYWLQRAFTAETLKNALRLSSEIGKGLLRYICETGFAA